MTRWFEDVEPGERFPIGTHSFTEEEIVRFALNYDPQSLHVDPKAAEAEPFGGLTASGWHAVVVGHRKMVDALEAEAERLRREGQRPGVSGPSPGVNRIEISSPVRPGDTLTYSLTITGKRVSNSLPGWGLLFNRIDAVNQRGEAVYHADVVGFSKRRDYKMPLGIRLKAVVGRLVRLLGLVARQKG